MSHNKITVSGKSPNSAGEIALNLGDVTTLGTVASGGVLTKSAAGWITSQLSGAEEATFAYNNQTTTGGSTSYTYKYEDNLILRSSSSNPQFTLTDNISIINCSVVTYNPLSFSNTTWYQAYTFNGAAFSGKRVLLFATIGCQMTTSANISFQMGIGYAAYSSFTPIGPRVYHNYKNGAVIYGTFVGSGSDQDISIKCTSATGTIYIMLSGTTKRNAIVGKIIS